MKSDVMNIFFKEKKDDIVFMADEVRLISFATQTRLACNVSVKLTYYNIFFLNFFLIVATVYFS